MAKTAVSWVPGMANSHVTREKIHVVLIKYISNQAETFLFMHAEIISDNSGGILASVLKVDQTVVKFRRYRRLCLDPYNAAH